MALTKVQAGGINLADTFAFTGTVSGAGKVLQIQFNRNTTAVAASDTTTFMTAVSQTITPTSSSNKIIINGSMPWLAYAQTSVNATMRLIRTVGGSDTTLQQLLIYNTHGSGSLYPYNYSEISFPYLDEPSTTSEITYKITFKTQTRSGLQYESRTNAYGGGSLLVLQEVSP
tara:strand:- start:44 stop:559 length:516 start_codon:yes stop_codon:yes gene_type:complete